MGYGMACFNSRIFRESRTVQARVFPFKQLNPHDSGDAENRKGHMDFPARIADLLPAKNMFWREQEEDRKEPII